MCLKVSHFDNPMDMVFSIEKDKAYSQSNIHGKAYNLRL